MVLNLHILRFRLIHGARRRSRRKASKECPLSIFPFLWRICVSCWDFSETKLKLETRLFLKDSNTHETLSAAASLLFLHILLPWKWPSLISVVTGLHGPGHHFWPYETELYILHHSFWPFLYCTLLFFDLVLFDAAQVATKAREYAHPFFEEGF